jgi:hypothetical protein
VGQFQNLINSLLTSINVTICWRILAESRREVSMAFVRERYRKKPRNEESSLFAFIMPVVNIVQNQW